LPHPVATNPLTSPPPIPDLDIYRAAKLLVDQHGEDASLRAAERADALLDGDVEVSAVWRAILVANPVEQHRSRRCGVDLAGSPIPGQEGGGDP
jgi:hypothetical protein